MDRSPRSLTIACVLLLGVTLPGAALAATRGPAAVNSPSTSTTAVQVVTAEEVAEANAPCAACHTAAAASFESSDTDSDCLAIQHTAVPCISCHPATEAYTKVHEQATPEKADRVTRLRKTSVEPELCISCHGPVDQLAKATEDCVALTDTVGNVVNPHDLPRVPDHEKLTCPSCHTMHANAKPADEQALKKCIGCHHARVFECGTCHE